MIGATYSFYLRDPLGVAFRKNITDLVQSFSCTRVVGARGAATLALAAMPVLFVRDLRLIVRRELPGQPSRLLFDTVWHLRAPKVAFDGGAYQHQLAGYDLNDLAYARRVLYKSGTAQAKKTAALDDMLKAVARENMGSLATDTARSWASYLSIQPDLALAPSQSRAFAWRWQHEVFQELCQASAEDDTTPTYLAWDIVATSETAFQLQTFTGQRGGDKRASGGRKGGLIFSPERGNVSRAEYAQDYRDEVTHVTAGGKGKASRRATQTKESTARIGASPFGLREDFVDARQADTTAELKAEARSRLREGRPTELLDITLQETPATIFGVHFGLGDYVTTGLAGATADARLDAMTLSVRNNGDAGWTEALGVVARTEREV